MKRSLGAIAAFIGLLITPSMATLKVGVTSGPHAIIMDYVKKEASKEGLEITVIEFNDFILPNAALNEGELDVNCYQHQPFLEEQIKTRGYKILSIGKSVLMPFGFYSKSLKKIEDFKEGAKIAIPNDPTNGGRALLLLQKLGFLKLKDCSLPSILDITENLKKVDIIELEAPQLPRSLDEVDAAVINTDWIILAGMDPKTALATEGINSPYANIIATREENIGREDIQKFLKVYQSEKTKAYILETFKGSVLPVW